MHSPTSALTLLTLLTGSPSLPPSLPVKALDPSNAKTIERDDYGISLANMDE